MRVPDTIYPGIPSYDEFRRKMPKYTKAMEKNGNSIILRKGHKLEIQFPERESVITRRYTAGKAKR